jgi:EAL domain-containing protein (putative c-di-GMP-specific phosphodiesterase class I)
MEDRDRALATLRELSSIGVGLSIDDFGTGYSSLAYLRELPVSELKIDRSFVLGLGTPTADEAIIRSTIILAHNMGLRVTAEGVENEKALTVLRRLGCDMAQGYFIGRPKSSTELEQWMVSGTYEVRNDTEKPFRLSAVGSVLKLVS